MSVETPQLGEPTGQFSIAAMLKLIALLSGVLAISAATGEQFLTLILAGAVLGIFLAEHFAKTPVLEMLFLLGTPTLCGSLAASLSAFREMQSVVEWKDLPFYGLVGALVGFIPAVAAIVVVNMFSALVFRVTGVRLLKFEWNPPD